MTEQEPESTQFRMTRHNLVSMVEDEFKELVCQNGQILMRGRSIIPSYIVQEIKKDREIHPAKRPQPGTVDSILGEFPLLGLVDQDELDKHDSFQPEVPDRNDCDMFDTGNNNNDVNLMDSYVVPVYKDEDLQPRKACKFIDENCCESSFQQWQASAPLNRSIVNPCQTSRLQHSGSGFDKHADLRNFSLFLKPFSVYKANGESNNRGSDRLEELRSNNNNKKPPSSSSNPIESAALEPTRIADKMKSTQPVGESPAEPPSDEQSEAVVHKHLTRRCPDKAPGPSSSLEAVAIKRKSRDDQVGVTNSISSLGASNDLTYYLSRRCEDDEGIACPSDLNDEEEQVAATETASARGNTGAKRKRVAEVHNLSERRRRDKINKKIRALQDLLPSSSKVDRASILDEAIDYLKALQLQVQIMSMGSGICVPPMLLPTGIPNFYAPHLAHFSPMGIGMGTRMHMAAPFSTSAMNMIGLPRQLPPLMLSLTPFINPLTGMEPLNSVPMFSSKDAVQYINLEMLNNGNIMGTNLPYSNQARKESSQ